MKRTAYMASALLLITLTPLATAETIAYTGAIVHTMGPAGTIENATIVIRNDRFEAVGGNLSPPGDARVIDVTGKIITPGLFSPMGQMGLTEVSGVDESVDFYQSGTRFSASFDIADAYNHRSPVLAVNRSGGITRAVTAPSPELEEETAAPQVFSGLAAVVQLGDRPDFIADRGCAMVVNLGEVGSAVSRGSRAAAILGLRAALDDGIDYRRNKDAVERGQRRDYSISIEDLEALQPVIAGRTPLLVNVNRASDIETIVRIASEYGLALILYGGAEAWMVADLLAANNVAVILDSKANLPASFDALNARLEAPAILAKAGVDISFGVDWQSETHTGRNITQSAGNAVANGLPWMEALEAITIAPARMYGVDDRFGSIEPGKEADLIVWPADPLELTSNPDDVMIRGQQVSLENRQTLLRDRYLQADSAKPPAFRK